MKTILAILFLSPAGFLHAQDENNYISNGNDLYRQSKFDNAELQYRQALKLNPNSIVAKRNLANALMQQKKYKEAITLYEQTVAVAQNNDKEVAYYNAGVAYTKQKDLQASIDAYKNALRIGPDDQQARENLQKALSELKKQQDEKKKQQNQQSKINPQKAEDKLKQLEQKEKEAQKRMQQQNKGKGGNRNKDW